MKKFYLPLSAICLFVSMSLFFAVRAGNIKVLSASVRNSFNKVAPADSTNADSTAELDSNKASTTFENVSNLIYNSLGLNKLGLSKEAMLYAYKGFQNLAQKGLINNTSILTICDFTQSSHSKRMYIIDIKNLKVLLNTYVAHGRNSGLDYAESFSNAPESLESSLGFYVTKNTYQGKHGLSLRLSGLDKGFNDNAESRDVVVHGAPYVGDRGLTAAYMGRSWGCPAVPQNLAPKVINMIKGGTCLFIYHPSQQYLQGSTVLNG